MKKIQHTITDGEYSRLVVHYDGPFDSYSLCGQDVVGDDTPGDSWGSCVPSTKRVNCDQCIAIKNHVLNKEPQ